ncbi:hypothetical protein PHMEG_00016747 [Phytophthora megakarya]|uniref:RNase H type-1 domain-containing protein n=1 Tax=Phytophthora megakarya TaxID=4795 RepID=A0A225VYG9_9STRA|nr:hypothetical protein PHMEG_00016747 [Phytophthora megakarya]
MQTPTVESTGCVALGSARTTNNTAEFTGLLTILHYASTHNIPKMHMAGDSMLIISMMKERRPPKTIDWQNVIYEAGVWSIHAKFKGGAIIIASTIK